MRVFTAHYFKDFLPRASHQNLNNRPLDAAVHLRQRSMKIPSQDNLSAVSLVHGSPPPSETR